MAVLMPRGVDYKIPLADLLQAPEQHQRGWSLRSICRLKWSQWGYASVGSALEGLRRALRTIDAPVCHCGWYVGDEAPIPGLDLPSHVAYVVPCHKCGCAVGIPAEGDHPQQETAVHPAPELATAKASFRLTPDASSLPPSTDAVDVDRKRTSADAGSCG